MKTFLNKTEAGQSYLQELQEKYGIKLDYGNPRYKYTKPFKTLEDLTSGKQFIKSGGVETPYYLIDYPLPDSINGELKELRLVYNSLHSKYAIWGWDSEKNLTALEFISEKSAKDLVNTIEKEKNKKGR